MAACVGRAIQVVFQVFMKCFIHSALKCNFSLQGYESTWHVLIRRDMILL